MKRYILIPAALFLISGCGLSGMDGALSGKLDEAARSYEERDYGRAAMAYEEIAAEGLASGGLYYNLGNAYLMQDKTGKAVLNYARARLLMPRDSDLVANHSKAISRMKQKDVSASRDKLSEELARSLANLSTGESVFLFFILYYVFALLFAAALILKRGRPLILLAALLTGALFYLSVRPVMDRLYEEDRGAIVISPIADVRSQPYEDAPVSFPMYEGMKAYVLRETIGWAKIKRPDNRSGWIKSDSIEKICP